MPTSDHVCDIRGCLYGCGHHILDIKPGYLGGLEFKRVIHSIAICRECGQTWKLAQYWAPDAIRELKKECTKKEYSELLVKKFHALGMREYRDQDVVDIFEKLRTEELQKENV